jgi:hypothetical protein
MREDLTASWIKSFGGYDGLTEQEKSTLYLLSKYFADKDRRISCELRVSSGRPEDCTSAVRQKNLRFKMPFQISNFTDQSQITIVRPSSDHCLTIE